MQRRRFLLVVLVAVPTWLSLLLGTPAGAHAEFEQAEPRPNATLPASPGRIRVVLTERANPLSRLSLVGPDGKRVGLGSTHVVGRVLEATVGPLRSGPYTVRWAAFSDEDGHLVAGSYRFRIGPGRLAESSGAAGLDGLVSLAGRLLLLAGAMLWAGSLVVGLLLQRPATALAPLASFNRRLARVTGWAAVGTIVGELANLWVASRRGLPLWTGGFFLGSATGRLLLARVTVLAAGLALSGWPRWRTDGRRVQLPLAWGYLALLSFSGHARLAPAGPISGPLLDAVHLLAGSAWLGGITLLGLVLRPGPDGVVAVAEAARRFSPVALAAAATLGVTGVFSTEQQLLSASDLSQSAYGRFLVAKLVLVAVLVAMSAHVGFVLRPALIAHAPGSARAATLASRLLRNLRAEAVVAVGIVTCVALMTSRASPQAVATARRPARSPAEAPAPVLARQEVGGRDVSLAVVPGRRGLNRLVVVIEGGEPVEGVKLRVDRPGSAGAAVWLPVVDRALATEVDLPAAGEWRARVTVAGTEGEFAFTVGEAGRAHGAVQAVTIADLQGPARERCRAEILGQQVAFAEAGRPLVHTVLDAADLDEGTLPGPASVLLGGCGTDGERLAGLADGHHVPLVAAESAPSAVWSWRLSPQPDVEGRSVAHLGFDELGGHSAAVAFAGPVSSEAARGFVEQFSASGGKVDGAWDLQFSTADAVATQVAARRVDLFVLFGSPEATVPLASALDRRGWRPAKSVLAGSLLFGPEILDAAPGWSRAGIVNVAGYEDLDVKVVSPYVRGLLESFPGERPSLRGLAGFLEGRLLLDVLAGLGPGAGPEDIGRTLDTRFRRGWGPGAVAVGWQPGRHDGATQLALFQLTPTLNIFGLLGGQHSGHAVGGLLYEGGDLQRITSFVGPDGRARPEGAVLGR
jgi:copper transport protein